jgi:hypothetical protein
VIEDVVVAIHVEVAARRQLLADGVDNSDDLAVLWQLGFDAATGPALVRETALVPETAPETAAETVADTLTGS